MERYRLKNIVILILLLLNLFLLAMVGARQHARQNAQQDLIDQTVALLSHNGIAIDPQLLQESAVPAAYACVRSTEEERAFSEALLGEILSTEDAGGGTLIYRAEHGSATFRSNGSFTVETTAPAREVTAYDSFIADACPTHYALADLSHTADETELLLHPEATIDGFPVYGASMELSLRDGRLSSAGGYFIPSALENAESGEAISRASAAVYLMDYCREEGRICNTISAIHTGYLLQSTTSTPLLLTPIYQIETNTYDYYVNAASGQVSPVR